MHTYIAGSIHQSHCSRFRAARGVGRTVERDDQQRDVSPAPCWHWGSFSIDCFCCWLQR